MPEEANSNIIWLIVGPSGTGKTTLQKSLVQAGMIMPVSYATREKRPKEVDGVDYNFISKEQFDRLEADDAFVEHVCYGGNYYGFTKDQIENGLKRGHVILVVEGHGAEQFKRIYGNRCRVIFMLPPEKDELARRLAGRGENVAFIEKRMALVDGEMSFLHLSDVSIPPLDPEGVLHWAFIAINAGWAPDVTLVGSNRWRKLLFLAKQYIANRFGDHQSVRYLLGGHWEQWNAVAAPLAGWFPRHKCYHQSGMKPMALLEGEPICEHWST